MHIAAVFYLIFLAVEVIGRLGRDLFDGSPVDPQYVEFYSSLEESIADCNEKVCKDTEFCATVYSKQLKTCEKVVDLPGQIIRWNYPKVLKIEKSDWTVDVLKITTVLIDDSKRRIATPLYIYLLDDVMKGRNVGLVEGMEMETANLEFTEGGIRKFSKRKYARNTKKIEKVNNHLMEINDGYGKYSMFTITVWIKTDASEKMGIFGFFDNDNGLGLTLWLWGRGDRLALTNTYTYSDDGDDEEDLTPWARTVKNDTGKNGWRHIAVKYAKWDVKKPTPQFFLNGRPWRLEGGFKKASFKLGTHLIFWGGYESHAFLGSMACLMYFSNYLTDDAISRLMNSCP